MRLLEIWLIRFGVIFAAAAFAALFAHFACCYVDGVKMIDPGFVTSMATWIGAGAASANLAAKCERRRIENAFEHWAAMRDARGERL